MSSKAMDESALPAHYVERATADVFRAEAIVVVCACVCLRASECARERESGCGCVWV